MGYGGEAVKGFIQAVHVKVKVRVRWCLSDMFDPCLGDQARGRLG